MPRSLATAIGPVVSAYLLSRSSFGWPLIAAKLSKIVYDIVLYLKFRNIRPPEQRPGKLAPTV